MPRESIALRVYWRLIARSASAIPWASRSITDFVASGVTSRGPRPVPPVVRITCRCSSSHHARSVAAICSYSSGTTTPALITTFGSCATSVRVCSPLISTRSPLATPSLIVRTPTLIILQASRCQLAHQRADLATRTIEPDGIFVGQILNLNIAAHLASQLAGDVQKLAAFSQIAALRARRQAAQALLWTQCPIDQSVELVHAEDDLQWRHLLCLGWCEREGAATVPIFLLLLNAHGIHVDGA